MILLKILCYILGDFYYKQINLAVRVKDLVCITTCPYLCHIIYTIVVDKYENVSCRIYPIRHFYITCNM